MAINSSAGGKGSGARPMEISRDQFANNFDAIFRKNPKPLEPVRNSMHFQRNDMLGEQYPTDKGKEPPQGDPAFESR